jgi:hypothetical protein
MCLLGEGCKKCWYFLNKNDILTQVRWEWCMGEKGKENCEKNEARKSRPFENVFTYGK